MSLVSYHSQGTASVNNGQTAVTFSGASLVSAGIQPGDYFFAQGLMVPLATVGGQNAATLVSGWPGANLSSGNYQIVPAAEGARVALSARLVLEKLTNGNIEALAGLSLIANRGVYADGAGSLGLFSQSAFGRAIQDLTGANGSFIRATGSGAAAMQAILGTVSQSGGVPTGALFESGSNANGHYARFAGGIQICWTAPRTLTASSSSAVNATWTFPATFGSSLVARGIVRSASGTDYSGVPFASIGALYSNGPQSSLSTAVTMGFFATSPGAFTIGGTMENNLFWAIGRWF